MDKKIWSFVFILLTLVVVSGLVAANVPDKIYQFVNANECTKDGSCEVRAIELIDENNTKTNLLIDNFYGGAQILLRSAHYVPDMISLKAFSNGGVISINRYGGVPAIHLSSYEDSFIDPYFGNVGIGTQEPSEKLEVDGDVKVTGLASNSTGYSVSYVCADYDGKLFRSDLPCR